MKIVFAAVVLFTVAASGAFSQVCHVKEVDFCMAIGILHYQSKGIAKDDEEVTEWCETMEEIVLCMSNFSNNCLSAQQKEIVLLFYGGDETRREMCTEGSAFRARYLKHAECLSESIKTEEYQKNLRDMQVIIDEVSTVPHQSRITLFCCGFGKFHKTLSDYVRRRCGEEALDMFHSIIKMATNDMPETICQKYDPASEKCQEILPPPGTQPKSGEERTHLAKLFDTIRRH